MPRAVTHTSVRSRHTGAGSGLPAGSALQINVLSGLSYWTGNGAVSFGAPPSSETLRLAKGSNQLLVGVAALVVAALIFGPKP